MIRKTPMLAIVCILTISAGLAQASPADSATTAWNALSNPVMDPAKSAHMENVTIVRDRVRITLTDGTIQFTQPANGVVFGAVFHGKGRVQIDPPNPIEAQQLRLFTKQDKVDMAFTDATFSFTDGLLEEVGKQVKWQASGPAPDDTYAKRQKERGIHIAASAPSGLIHRPSPGGLFHGRSKNQRKRMDRSVRRRDGFGRDGCSPLGGRDLW
jgi:hypothetical protein